MKSVGVVAEVGAWEGDARAEGSGTTMADGPGPLSQLILPTGSIALPSGKDATAVDPRERKEGKIQLP
jgi:hypothetical protein